MIITLLMRLVLSLLNLLLVFELPQLPAEAMSSLSTVAEYFSAGAGILANYTNIGYLFMLMGIIIAIDVGIGIYHFVMWILKKIPVLGIE